MPNENAVLVFETAHSKFAIHVDKMIEIIEMVEIRTMPNSPLFIKGVINYRGKVVPICDLNYMFEAEAQKITLNTPIVMVDIDSKPVGFIVNSVIGVQPFDKENVIPLSEKTQDYVTEAFQYQDSVLLIIDLAKVFNKADKEALENHLEDLPHHIEEAPEPDQPIMHKRAISLSKSMSTKKRAIEKFICFKANDEFYGLNIDYVDTVLKMQKVHWVPGLPNFVLGVFNKRGEVVSVTDLKAFLGLPKTEPTNISGLIVVKNEAMETALLVDEVVGVIDVEHDKIQPPPAVLNKEQVEYIQGEVHLKDALLVIVNAEKLLEAKKLTMFEAVS